MQYGSNGMVEWVLLLVVEKKKKKIVKRMWIDLSLDILQRIIGEIHIGVGFLDVPAGVKT